MVDWHSVDEQVKDASISAYLAHALFGLYLWEFATSLGFEWEVLTRRRRFRWWMIFYFAGRYCLLGSLIAYIVSLNVESGALNCEAVWICVQFLGAAASGFSSINLSLRTIAIWDQNRYVVSLIVLIILGHWALIAQTAILTTTVIPEFGCVVATLNLRLLVATFFYSIFFDLVVLLLRLTAGRAIWTSRHACLMRFSIDSAWKLRYSFGGGSGKRNAPIVTLLFKDGLIYFLVAYVCPFRRAHFCCPRGDSSRAGFGFGRARGSIVVNLLAGVFMILNLNGVMSTVESFPPTPSSSRRVLTVTPCLPRQIFETPALVFSTIAASRVVRRLHRYQTPLMDLSTIRPSTRSLPLPYHRYSRGGPQLRDHPHPHRQSHKLEVPFHSIEFSDPLDDRSRSHSRSPGPEPSSSSSSNYQKYPDVSADIEMGDTRHDRT
ncbi:hypothetical protein PUNSTDRAFT_134500 [Punctularia strigosozonata HHB-11173 SS5]|uniref:uncharacterized protein n=1 Tax=Punctularia strigosozonata (strain HHB-11173) TaxID=741275 RepID=UPI00044170E2|nr:uncharacterized protein PUNSTDRAFT_134500 [Punctularia strigosozonata HHB-11173 SS5]EIN09347.1 hypothetical protein PUNSTDRAFT_134500 [Punctularia strigosozonata HHB-11173 SS5]